MLVTRKITVIAILILLISVSGCFNSKKHNQEMQEACGKTAAKYFADNFPSSAYYGRYDSHYNSKEDKCFIKVYGLAKTSNSIELHLIDINDNKSWGYCSVGSIIVCEVAGKKCDSGDKTPFQVQARWNALAKKYMEQ